MAAERGIYGLVLMDTTLTVRRRYGRLVEFVREGAHIADSVPPLVGLDGQIKELRYRNGMLDIPAVAIIGGNAPAARLNLTVFWLEPLQQHLLLVSKAQGHVDLELQMSRLMRARLMAEAEATQRAKELARVNRDLDEFASIVSHDLQAPMRAIRYLADDLDQTLADPEGNGDPAAALARIREQSRRMTTMLNQLHQYARTGYKHTMASAVDTRALTEAIVRSLPRPPGFRIEIDGDWPVLVTLESQLDLVIRNLVENAIKHHDRRDGLVRITGAPTRAALQIEIVDDGPGIPPRHHTAVFEPFRTLSDGEDGGGMGLAFVKKTVEAAGGRIALRSDPTIVRGTTFSITWPLSLPE